MGHLCKAGSREWKKRKAIERNWKPREQINPRDQASGEGADDASTTCRPDRPANNPHNREVEGGFVH